MVKAFCIILAALSLSACGTGKAPENAGITPSQSVISEQESHSAGQDVEVPSSKGPSEAEQTEDAESRQEESALKITVGEYAFQATFEHNSSAEEFQALLEQGPVTIEMADYGGFEKVGPLGTALTRNDTQITTAPGDVILYQGNQITIYYGTNSWNFTKLATIDDPTDLKTKLGDGTVQVTFSLD